MIIDLERAKSSLVEKEYRMHELFGSKVHFLENTTVSTFLVYAPNADKVETISPLNTENVRFTLEDVGDGLHYLEVVEDLSNYIYMYKITSLDGDVFIKSDPFGITHEVRPSNATVFYPEMKYEWNDKEYLDKKESFKDKPMSILEVHLGSFQRKSEHVFCSYKELAHLIVEHCYFNAYNYVELLPITEHPLDESWGYQVTGYFSPTSRFGKPEDFKEFVDILHQSNIGVIFDFVPGHMCKDSHGLYNFDGDYLFNYKDKSKSENDEWGTPTFNLKSRFVVNFLISSVVNMIENYHIDGIRVDAVSTLFHYFGKRNLGDNKEGQSFLRELNEVIRNIDNRLLSIAEDSSSEPGVTTSVKEGGFGFTHKWNMGFMNNTLRYIKRKADKRFERENLITFPFEYSTSENYVLPFSHDEVVHMKGSAYSKYYHGSLNEKNAHYKLLIAHYMLHPGKKLFFMGQDFAQSTEWNCTKPLPWDLFALEQNKSLNRFFVAMQHLYFDSTCLHTDSNKPNYKLKSGLVDSTTSFYVYSRFNDDEEIISVFNFSYKTISFDLKDFEFNFEEYELYADSEDPKYEGNQKIHHKEIMKKDNFKTSISPFSCLVYKNKRS